MPLRKTIWLFIFLAGALKICCQTDQVKTLFFGLELDSSISGLQQTLRKDIRFSEVTEFTEQPMVKYTGNYVAPRAANSTFDSAALSLKVLVPVLVNKLEHAPHSKEYCTLLVVTQYFHSFEQAYKSYESATELLMTVSLEHRAHNDHTDASMYSDFKLEGHRNVRTQLVSETNGSFKLLLSYSCRAAR